MTYIRKYETDVCQNLT